MTLERVSEDGEGERSGVELQENRKGVRPRRRRVRERAEEKQGREGQKLRSQRLSTHRTPTPLPPLQKTQVTSKPFNTSQAPRLPRTCNCESQEMLTHNDIKDVFFY